LQWSGSASGAYGALTVNSNGAYSYAVNATAVNALQAGASPVDSFTVTVTDLAGATATRTIAINVVGANDAPIASGTYSHTVTDTAIANTFSNITGSLSASDADTADALQWSGSASGAYGALTVNANGTYSYAVNATAVNALQAGASPVDSFTVTVTDLAGATATRTIAINVVGANDTPVASGAYSHTVTDTAIADTYSVLTGSLAASDRDSSDTLVWSGSSTGAFGSLLVNSNGSYSFTPNPTAINAVQAGATPSDTFTVVVSDLAGATATRTIAINVVGANDTPVATGAYAHSVADTSAVDSFAALTGSLVASDRDALDTLVWSGSRVGNFGALTVNSSGSYSYAVDSGAVDALEAGASAVDTFVATVTDALGATATRTITVNFTGIDDTPYLVVGNDHLMQGTRDSDTLFGSDLPSAEMATFIGGGGNDSLNLMTTGQAFAGGDGFDSVKFNVHSIAVADITGIRSHFEINMLPDSRATNPGVISDEFASAVNASSASTNDFGFLQIFNQDRASAFVQAEKISIDYDGVFVNNFLVSKDASTGRGLLTLSSADDRILAITADQIDGGAGNDVIYAYGNASEGPSALFAPVSISGGTGNDILAAGTPGAGVYNSLDEASLNGGDGNDVLVAVSGKVTATGGAGRDVFALNSSAQHVDLFINNFNANDDVIDLSAFSALHSGSSPTAALSAIVQSALSAAPSHGGQIELDFSAYCTAGSSAGHAKVTINSLESSAAVTISNFVFSEQTWSPTNWHDNLNPLVNS